MDFLKHIILPTRFKRTLFFMLSDVLLIAFSFYFSFYIRLGFVYPVKYEGHFFPWLPAFILIKIALLGIFNIYRLNWRFVGLDELGSILKSALISTFLLYAGNLVVRYYFYHYTLPRGLIIIDGIVSFGLIGFLRISKRLYIDFFSRSSIGKRTLVIGADLTSERVVNQLKSSRSKLIPVAYIDESRMRIGTRINGLPVVGGFDLIETTIRKESVDAVLINLPKASHKKITELFHLIHKAGVDEIKIVPQVDQYTENVNVVKDIKNLDIEDLLSRESVRVDYDNIRQFLQEKTILVSGAAGSIGSEIVRKLVQFGVPHILCCEIDETELFNLQHDVARITDQSQTIEFIVCDVRDRRKMERVFDMYKPHIIFHASAYKHVPLMEQFPEEAVKTNILGTLIMAELAVKHKVARFINISTDKAVNPTSIMGATKRFSEMVCRSMNNGVTAFTSVRFGNVLGSRGSVIPLFLEQIKDGGPVTVTHPDIQRYFMSIPESVLLVFQAAYMSHENGGETFVLDMGEPVKIVHLAENLIRLNNMEPYTDIDIIFTGLRPGEKLFEELLTAEEGTDATTHSKIFIARKGSLIDKDKLNEALEQLNNALDRPAKITGILQKHIPYFKEKD